MASEREIVECWNRGILEYWKNVLQTIGSDESLLVRVVLFAVLSAVALAKVEA